MILLVTMSVTTVTILCDLTVELFTSHNVDRFCVEWLYHKGVYLYWWLEMFIISPRYIHFLCNYYISKFCAKLVYPMPMN